MKKFILPVVLLVAMVGCTTPPAADQTQTYSTAQIAEHASQDDCWMAIDGKVYDATSYIEEHPPGADSIVRGCGEVYTQEEFEEVSPHKNAASLLEPLYVGELD